MFPFGPPPPYPTRVAVLDFGPPSSWQGEAGDEVGLHITADEFRTAIPLLEEDKIDVVVLRVNSGGGHFSEVEKFHEVFREYKTKFRTVTWIEKAIGSAVMGMWTIQEQYMMPRAAIGACTLYRPLNGGCATGAELDANLATMEQISQEAGHNPLLMRAMQVYQPLSVSVNPANGVVTYYDDAHSGDILLNNGREILVLTAPVAEKIKFSKGTAATLDELMKVLGIGDYELGGEEATRAIDRSMRDATVWEREIEDVLILFGIAAEAASKLTGDEHGTERLAQVNIARRYLNDLRSLVSINPMFGQLQEGLPAEWFDEQERILKELSK